MAYRRKIIDRRTREGKKLGRQLDAFQGFLFLAFLAVAAVGGLVHSLQGPGASQDALVTPASAAPIVSGNDTQASSQRVQARQSAGYAASPSGYGSIVPPSTLAMNSVPPMAAPPTGEADTGRPPAPWRHVTAGGTRWSLRRLDGTALLLVVDLGSAGQVANVRVAPAFEQLDMAAMNMRVDHLRSEITRFYPLRTADYAFERDGSIRPLQ